MRAGLDSPLGPLWIEIREGAITALGWRAAGRSDEPLALEAQRQLTAYFDGGLTRFDLPLRAGRTDFQERFYAALRAIPFGETRTYGDLAAELGVSAQAIGQACGGNPIPILIPCRRVLAAHSLGGFSGSGGVETKVALLRHEGAAGLLI